MVAPMLNTFAKRRLFGGSDVCLSFQDRNQAQPITGSLTFHHLMLWISLAATVICVIVTIGLSIGHIFNYRQPQIQKQLIRVIYTAPVFAVFSVLGVWNYHITSFMTPIAELYEVFALVSIFFLLIAYLVPQPTWENQIAFFSQPENGGYQVFRKTYMMVIQALAGRIITTIALEIVNGVNCVGGQHYRRGNTIISVVNGIQVTLALVALLKFLMRFRTRLQAVDSKVMGKLLSFKLIVGIQFVQKIVLNILTQAKVLNPTRTMSYNDLNLGLNSFLTCLEVFIISLFMIYFYNPRLHGKSADFVFAGQPGMLSKGDGGALEQGVGRRVANPKMSVFRALWDAVDMLDVVRGMGRALSLFRQG